MKTKCLWYLLNGINTKRSYLQMKIKIASFISLEKVHCRELITYSSLGGIARLIKSENIKPTKAKQLPTLKANCIPATTVSSCPPIMPDVLG